jgi:glyoxylase I family protein
MGRDENTPNWVQHLALKVKDEDSLMAAKARIEDVGIDVLGPTDHGVFKSIYVFDPNGHRIELACNTATPEVWEKVAAEAPAMLEEWNKTKSVPKHVAWVHEKEFEDA